MKRQILVLLCTTVLVFSQACATNDSAPRRPATGGEIAAEAGLGVGAFVATVLYAPFKVAYATGGLITGGLAWLFSGADDDVARKVMEPALAGDYVITPDRLRDPASIEFVGRVEGPGGSDDRDQIAARARTAHSELAAVSSPPPRSAESRDIAVSASVGERLATGACAGAVALPPIQFAPGKVSLSRSSRTELDVIPPALSRCSESRVRIVGHADATGTEANNLRLSQQRARSIRDHLVARGVDPQRLEIVAAGEAKPTSSNSTSAGRASNRRAEVVVVMR